MFPRPSDATPADAETDPAQLEHAAICSVLRMWVPFLKGTPPELYERRLWQCVRAVASATRPQRATEAELIAAAPGMASLLRELYAEHGNRHTFDWAYWHSEIETLLRKAGAFEATEPADPLARDPSASK